MSLRPAVIFARPERSRVGHGPRRGFTLLEILLVVAVLGLTATLFLSGANDWLRARERTPEDIFWEVVAEARQLALRHDQAVVLSYEEKTRQLQWLGSGEGEGTRAWPGRNVEFLPAQETDTVLLGGRLEETGRLPVVRFYADGSCDAFRVLLTEADGRKRTLNLDPWTCAPMLAAGPRR